jgi:hypothetical protein
MNSSLLLCAAGALFIALVLWDAFETIVFPRRVTRRVRLTRLFYRSSWRGWKYITGLAPERHEEGLLSIYGPLSLIVLLILWAFLLVVGFALIHLGVSILSDSENTIASSLYFSGTTFFTLGLGDLKPLSPVARFLTVMEAGTGLGFLAIIIGYLPALNQSFSRREVNISLLDSRAGSPPTAAAMLSRQNDEHGMESIRQVLNDWEKWSAELLESHLSYPVLAYYRSQHDNQSWLAAFTAILDASALVMVGVEGACVRQAQLTFAMARHAVVDLCFIFGLKPEIRSTDRLPPEKMKMMRSNLIAAGLRPKLGDEADRRLLELRSWYEPYLFALSGYFRLNLPAWIPEPGALDNWQAYIPDVTGGEAHKRPYRHF